MNYYRNFNEYLCNVLMIACSFFLGFRSVISFSNIHPGLILELLTVAVYGITFFIVLLNYYSLKEIFLVLFLFILGILIYFESKSRIPLYVILFMVAAKNKRINFILVGNVIGNLLGIFIVISYYFLGRIKTSLLDGGNSLGFVNPNTLSFCILYVTLIVIYLRFDKIQLIDNCIVFIITILNYFITKSKTGLIVGGFLFLVIFLVKLFPRFKFLFNNYSFICNICFFLLCIFGIILTNTISFFTHLNYYLSGRFGFAQIYLLVYGLHLFGADISDIDNYDYGHLVLDNGYARLFINYGIIYAVLFIVLLILFSKQKKELIQNKIFVFLIMLGLITETQWIPISTNMGLVICSSFVFNSIINNKESIRKNKFINFKYFLKI